MEDNLLEEENTIVINKKQWAKEYNVKPKTITTHLYYLDIDPKHATPLDIEVLREDLDNYIKRKETLWYLYRVQEKLEEELEKEEYYKNLDLFEQDITKNRIMAKYCKENKEYRPYIKHFVRKKHSWGASSHFEGIMTSNWTIMWDSYEDK